MKLLQKHQALALALLPLAAALGLAMANPPWFSEPHAAPVAQTVAPVVPIARQSATFILGSDDDSPNRYYEAATHYYSYTDSARTEYLITSCRSLQEVQHYLDSLPRPNNLPWGRINLVSHSNEWSDMGVAVVPDGPRTSAATIDSALAHGQLAPLPNRVLDRHTELVVHGCGLGRNTPVLQAIRTAFGGKDAESPVVKSARYFIVYESNARNGRPFECTKYLADAWYAHYPTGYHPGNHKLAAQFAANYPTDSINWQAALQRNTPATPGQPYCYSFKMPVVWYATYPSNSARPSVATDSAKTAWLQSQPTIQELIANYGFEQSDLTWTVYKTQYDDGSGKRVPAIKAIGLCNIVCVLKAFTEPNASGTALRPSENNPQFYTTIRG